MCPTAIAAPDAAVASAATACPARPAPSSRAIRATSTTTRAIARADGIRSPRGSAPNAHSERRPSSGVSADRHNPKRDVEPRRGSTARRDSRTGWPPQRAAVPPRLRPEERRPGDSRSLATHDQPTASRTSGVTDLERDSPESRSRCRARPSPREALRHGEYRGGLDALQAEVAMVVGFNDFLEGIYGSFGI